jgi:DNA-binding transcriptional LysR family regulator
MPSQPPRFSLRQLAYFTAVAESGSIRAASERLNVSQAAMSQALQELEDRLGSRLLTRRRAHGATLTAAGAELVSEAQAVLEAAAEFQAVASGLERGLGGHVRVGCYTSLAPFLIPRLVSGFAERLPAVVLDVAEGSAADVQARLRAGACEIALLYDVALDSDIERETLYVVRPSVILHPEHPLAGHDEVDLRALAAEPLILFDVPPAVSNTHDVLRRAGVAPRIGQRTTNFELVRSLVARGLGYSVLLQTPQPPFSYEGRPLVTRPIRGDSTQLAVVMSWARVGRLTRRAEFLRRSCRELLGA